MLTRIRLWLNARRRRKDRQLIYTFMPNPNCRSAVRQYGPRPR